MQKNNYFIFTGGPGAGKTTVLSILHQDGFNVSEESGRKIIQKQLKLKGDAVPWLDKQSYASLMWKDSLKEYHAYQKDNGIVFFDRGLADTLGYCLLEDIPVSSSLYDSYRKMRYNSNVFLFPFWDEIYLNDDERKQDRIKAKETAKMMERVYTDLGYNVIKVPFLSPIKRSEWIKDAVKNLGYGVR